MNTKVALIVWITFLSSLLLLGQSASEIRHDSQQQIESIVSRVRAGDTKALLELGSLGDTNAIPLLEKIVVEPIHLGDPNKEKRELATKALATLGVEQYYARRL